MQVLSQSEKQGIPQNNSHQFMDTTQYKRLSCFKTIYMHVCTSGDATNACVSGLASFLPVKFRLYEDTIVFLSPFLISCLKWTKKERRD